MVVGEDRRRSVDVQCSSHDFSEMDAGTVDRADEELFDRQDAVPVVQPEDVEFFVEQCAQAHAEKVGCVPGVADAAQPIEFASEDAFGCGEHVVLGGPAGESVVAFAVAEDAHLSFPSTPDCAVGFGKRSGNSLAAPGTSAVRALEGGNEVDEGTLARADREVTMTHMRCKPVPRDAGQGLLRTITLARVGIRGRMTNSPQALDCK